MKREPFTTLPLGALLDDRLNKIDLRVLLALASWRMRQHSVVWPTRQEIADRCGIHVSNVSRTTARLERYGWVKKHGGGGCSRPTTYILCDLQGVVPDDACTREALRTCATMRARGIKTASKIEQRKNTRNARNDAPPQTCVRQSGNVREWVPTDGGHSSAGAGGHCDPTLSRESENETEKQTEKPARTCARDALGAGVSDASDHDRPSVITPEVPAVPVQAAESADSAPATAPAAACEPNGDEAGQPPAPRKKRAQRPEDWAGVHIPRPDDVPEQLWRDFCALRRDKRATVTQSVLDGFRREAKRAGVSLAEAIRTATEHGWRGFRAEWIEARTARQGAAAFTDRRRMKWSGFENLDYRAGMDENGNFE